MSLTTLPPNEQLAKELLDPILSVFGAEDGGVAFTRLRHEVLPNLIAHRDNAELNEAVITMITQFSRLCQAALDKKI